MIDKLIDTHFHLDHYKNHQELYNEINQLQQYTLCVTNSPGIFVSCRRLYVETKYVKFALGFHPQDQNLSSKDFNNFLILLGKTNYVGEIGMDFSSTKFMKREYQVKYFDNIVRVCSECNKVMSVHLRKSENEAIDIIKNYHPQKCIIHWFTGTASQLDKLVSLGCYFSINSNMIQNTTKRVKLMDIPHNKILVESDGPFTKLAGKKYMPTRLLDLYRAIASYLDIPDFTNQVFINFKKLLSK